MERCRIICAGRAEVLPAVYEGVRERSSMKGKAAGVFHFLLSCTFMVKAACKACGMVQI